MDDKSSDSKQGSNTRLRQFTDYRESPPRRMSRSPPHRRSRSRERSRSRSRERSRSRSREHSRSRSPPHRRSPSTQGFSSLRSRRAWLTSDASMPSAFSIHASDREVLPTLSSFPAPIKADRMFASMHSPAASQGQAEKMFASSIKEPDPHAFFVELEKEERRKPIAQKFTPLNLGPQKELPQLKALEQLFESASVTKKSGGEKRKRRTRRTKSIIERWFS